MAWTFNGIRIFPQNMVDSRSQIIPRLQPLDSGTILQFFGYEDETKSMTSFVIGSSDKLSLEAMMTTGTSYELISPEGSLGNYFPQSINFDRVLVVSQTLRPDLSCYEPMYKAEMKLYKDNS